MKNLLKNCLLVLASTVIVLIGLEVVLRVANPSVGFVWRNFTTAPINLVQSMPFLDFDPELGYVQGANRAEIQTGPLGNRLLEKLQPGEAPPPIPEHSILAVGDSFTYGSDVGPDQSWPAYLHRILEAPVVNSGVGGYGIDQMVLMAERLVPKVKPNFLLLAFIPLDIDRTQMSVFSGASKPYFDVVDGKLVLRNTPVQPYHASAHHIGWMRSILGYSYLAAWTAERLGKSQWWQAHQWEFQRVHHKGIEVSCLLMKRFADLAARNDVPAAVVAEYGWNHFISDGAQDVEDARKVIACAREAGLDVIDTFDDFRSRLPAKRSGVFSEYFVNGVGHMTGKGNELVAMRIAAYLREKWPDVLK